MRRVAHVRMLMVGLGLALPDVSGAEVRAGGLGDLNLARSSFEDVPAGTVLKTLTRWGAGGLLEVSLGRGAALVLEPMFLVKGGALDEPATGARLKGRLTYVEVPVLLKYSFGEGPIRPYLLGGPSLGFLLAARTEITVDGTTILDEDVESDTTRTDFGLGIGGGVAMPAGQARLFVEAQYVFGLTNVDETRELTIRNRGLQLRAGVHFRLGR